MAKKPPSSCPRCGRFKGKGVHRCSAKTGMSAPQNPSGFTPAPALASTTTTQPDYNKMRQALDRVSPSHESDPVRALKDRHGRVQETLVTVERGRAGDAAAKQKVESEFGKVAWSS